MNAVSHLRIPTAFLVALLITGGLFSVLNVLTDVKFTVVRIEPIPIEFTKVRPDTDTQDRREFVKPERTDPPPALPVPRAGPSRDEAGPRVVTQLTPAIEDIELPPTPQQGVDTDAVPMVRIQPDYPQRALANGTEGWVQVRFTISASGAVIDPVVVDSSPTGVFEASALKAIARWRYNPKVDGGVAVERRGVETMLRFTLGE